MLLVTTNAGRELVTHASAQALRAGVRLGMTLAHARALLKEAPVVAPCEAENDEAGLRALARYVSRRWSPTVSADPPGGLLCEITGCEHLFGGERRLVRSLIRALASLGVTARTAIAPSVGAAWALARYSHQPHSAIDTGEERRAIAPLPVQALRLSPAVVESLREVGVERIGQLLALPRSALPARYGTEVLLRIDQALGDAFEPVLRIPDEERFSASMTLEGGTTRLESVQLALRATLTDLCGQLEQRELGLRRLTAVVTRLDAQDAELIVQVSRPTREVKHLWTLLCPKTERLNLGSGVEGITLRAELVVRMPHTQRTLDRGRSDSPVDEAGFAAMLDTIGNRIGAAQVKRAMLLQSYRPERAADFVEPAAVRAWDTARERSLGRPRPSRLLAEPFEIQVMAMSPDGPVLQISGLPDLAGRAGNRIITTSIGPERLGGEWWRRREATRDYFRVQDHDGSWLWIFRDVPSGAWFVHGMWA